MSEPGEPSDLNLQLRGRIAFEKMISAVLTGSAVGAGAALAINMLGLLVGGGGIEGVVKVILDAGFVGFVIFLVGFIAAVIVGAPLFTLLERAGCQGFWPYLAAAVVIALIATMLVQTGAPISGGVWRRLATALLPAIIAAISFARAMDPFWRQWRAEDAAAASGPGAPRRLH